MQINLTPMLRLLIILFITAINITNANARGTYQQPVDFINESFSGHVPEAKVFWLEEDIKKQLEDILAHKYKGSRIRYWQKGQRSVWVLEEKGKKKPITVGITIKSGHIERIKVLIFRESRGWEVRYPFFTKQYIDSGLNKNNKLDKNIDGISGATLSVRALTKLARIALLLNKQIIQNDSHQS